MATAVSTTMATIKAKRAGFWGGDAGSVWPAIDLGVNNTVRGIRVVQTVIAATLSPGMSVPDESLDPREMRFPEGLTKPYAELSVEFSLSSGQAAESNGAVATRLAKFAARDLAIAEDLIFLQGRAAPLPPTVRIESGGESLGGGLLGLVPPAHRIKVGSNPAGVESGAGVLAAIMKGIGLLVAANQSGPYYLIEDNLAYADTFGTVVNGNATNSVVTPALLGGSICSSAAMPAATALLIATGGDPTMIYVDTDPVTEPTHQGVGGRYFFRTYERVQYVASDPRAFVMLEFPKSTRK